MKEFKKFVKTEDSKKQKEQEAAKACNTNCDTDLKDLPDISEFNPDDVDMVKNLTDKYKGNRGKLINDIVNLASKNKKEGKLNNDELEKFEKKLAPMLNGEQKTMLKNIMGMIKE